MQTYLKLARHLGHVTYCFIFAPLYICEITFITCIIITCSIMFKNKRVIVHSSLWYAAGPNFDIHRNLKNSEY